MSDQGQLLLPKISITQSKVSLHLRRFHSQQSMGRTIPIPRVIDHLVMSLVTSKGAITPSDSNADGDCSGTYTPLDNVYGQDTKFVSFYVNDVESEEISDGIIHQMI